MYSIGRSTAVLAAVAMIAAVAATGCGSRDSVKPALRAGPLTSTAGAPAATSAQPAALPFTGLTDPGGIAVDKDGDVFVSDRGGAAGGRVLWLAAGSGSPDILPFTGSGSIGPIAATAGTLYVSYGPKVVKVASGSDAPTTLPFTGIGSIGGVAVDGAGTVYVTDTPGNRVLKLAPGAAAPAVLPFPGLSAPEGVAVDAVGNVYIADLRRVQKLTPGATASTVLPFPGLAAARAVAVDAKGTVYVADRDNDRILRLAAGATTATVVPFTHLSKPDQLAVDTAGDIYVTAADAAVLELPAAAAATDATPAAVTTPQGTARTVVTLNGVDQHPDGAVHCATANGAVSIQISGSPLAAEVTATDPPQPRSAILAVRDSRGESWWYQKDVVGTAEVVKTGDTYRMTGTAGLDGSPATTEPFEFTATCPS
ncbi:lipoprotein LpqH [Nocardia sp. alder85J]|uniref:lipoprotein LpqH n=1 Tax=Nocardia sp. alder85J TaxID=2862949 RepID=UPI001CD81A8B|nr:lipoprotein LpqH [Nocardia sp. alder85J]MCX4091844.1 lipoprotein LpqH [Nocardia sp. alder85J]